MVSTVYKVVVLINACLMNKSNLSARQFTSSFQIFLINAFVSSRIQFWGKSGFYNNYIIDRFSKFKLNSLSYMKINSNDKENYYEMSRLRPNPRTSWTRYQSNNMISGTLAYKHTGHTKGWNFVCFLFYNKISRFGRKNDN